ncbi:MAG: hypothetical protein QOI81_451 [Actinomycetota bacterium]|nr:hypothetical protein [Actinomycetota bacterium]
MLGDQLALVMDLKTWDVHGVGYVDITVAYKDRSVETARLGAESIPEGLAVGEEVLVSKAVNMIVAVSRPGSAPG